MVKIFKKFLSRILDLILKIMPFSREFFINTLPFTIGLIFMLTSLSFLVGFLNQNWLSFDDILDEEFLVFLLFAILGIPLTLYGINKASDE